MNDENTCIDLAHLRETLAQGRFVDPADTERALTHFTRPCLHCWQQFTILVEDHVEIDLDALEYRAAENPREPAVALALGRLILATQKPEVTATLTATHRHLLSETTWNRSFEFWWLVIEEARRLALSSKAHKTRQFQTRQPGDGSRAAHTLTPAYTNSTLDVELCLLMLAYQVDDLRLAGLPHAAATLFTEVAEKVNRCHRPEIRAAIHEVQADILWASSRDPSQVLGHLTRAEQLLKNVPIPGRHAEIQARITRARPRQAEVEAAFATFSRALAPPQAISST